MSHSRPSARRGRRACALAAAAFGSLASTGAAQADTSFEAETMTRPSSGVYVFDDPAASAGELIRFGPNATTSKTVTTEKSVRITVRARGTQCQGAPEATVKIDDQTVMSEPVPSAMLADYSVPVTLAAGSHQVQVVFANNLYLDANCNRDLYVDKVTFTADPSAPADPIIAAAGDIACDPASSSFNGGYGSSSSCRQKYTSDLLLSGVDRVLTLGDNQYENGALTKFRSSYDKSWGRVKSITRPAIGNHEYYVSGASGYFDYFNGTGVTTGPAGSRGKGYYSYDVGSWHVIALNSNCSRMGSGGCAAGSAQEKWLRADLAANPRKCTLAYWHHPRYSSGSHGNNTAVNPLWKALYAAGADVVLSGHDHDYERFAPQNPYSGADAARGIRQFVVGVGGKGHYQFSSVKPNSQVRNGKTFGVLKLTLRPASYDWRFVPEAGKTFTDSGSTACH